MGARRIRLTQHIFEAAKERKTNMETLLLVLSTMTDRELTKFHLAFIETKNLKTDETSN